ncbi:MAG: acetyl-CoA carboxylase carboxyltransferase subunit beta [Verrucomicrobia bacterium]|nr:MAG: acetyl-CoA carboxylase carboxyltransferase subunit beta [Verrucomicrobiota bacterium]
MSLFSKPKYSTVTVKKRDIPQGLWKKCPVSGEIIYVKELEENQNVVPRSGYHFPISAPERIAKLVDPDTWEEFDRGLKSVDALGFVDSKPYSERLEKYEKATGLNDAVACGVGRIHGIEVSLAVMDFRFAGGSMGSVVGEKITRAIERAIERKIPCIVFSASGGARMQEGILSLMQMAKTSAALAHLAEAKLPFISVLTNPTTGGVTASFAVLGDVILAEPGALIGFAGPRVIKETTQQELPEGFQSAEFLLEHGLIDQIVSRLEMRDRLRDILTALHVKRQKQPAEAAR